MPENPQLFVIFVSGYTQDILLNVPTTDEQVRYLAKPFTLLQLKEAIEQTRITRQIRG